MYTKPLVSIIVPSFNVEKYFKKCLDSIKSQTYKNWECIIIDRPSTKDNTTKLIKEYIKGDRRFVFIRQKNKGVSDGRNVGFEVSKGKYVQFTDPDDWLAPNLLELAVERAESTGADVVQFAWSNFYIQTGKIVPTGFMPFARQLPEIFSVASVGNDFFKYGEFYVNSMSKLWNRKFLQSAHLHYPTELKRAEDLAEVSRLIMSASRITYLDEILYFYKVDEYQGDSLSNFTSDDEHNLDFYKAIMIVETNMKKMKLLPKFSEGFCRLAIINSVYALNMSRLNIAINREVYQCIRQKILPIIADELKTVDVDMFELFSQYDHDSYIDRQIKELFSDNISKQSYINKLEFENLTMCKELDSAKDELKDHLRVLRSARLTVGNIKRSILNK